MRTYVVIFFGITILFFAFCRWFNAQTNSFSTEPRLRIVCTTSILADTVRSLVDDQVQVISLMGPGIDPHLYKARESDMRALSHADLIIYHGLHLEGKMADIFSTLAQHKKTIAINDVLDSTLLQKSTQFNAYDPHIWHDVRLWIEVVNHLQTSLTHYDQSNAKIYADKTAIYIQQLQELDNYVRKQSNSIPKKQRILVTAHDAFNYFAKAYDFEVVGLQGISTDSDISTKDIQNIVDYIIHHQVHTLFIESSIPQRSLQAVQNAVHARGWHVTIGGELYSDALGDMQTTAHTYIGMIKHNIDTIVVGLRNNYGTSS